jgi:hypothetical protein
MAQDTIQVGDSRMKYSTSSIGERKYVQYQETTDGLVRFNTLLTRRIQKIEIDGINGLLITQTYQSPTGVDTDSSYCNAVNLEPVYYRTDIKSEGYIENVVFKKNEITNITMFKDSVQTVAKENPGYFNGVMTDELIAALPLKEKASFILRTVNPGLRFYPYITKVVVDGKETIKVAGQDVLCWRLRVNHGGPTDSFEWYSVNNRIQVMKKFSLPDGSTFYRVHIPN